MSRYSCVVLSLIFGLSFIASACAQSSPQKKAPTATVKHAAWSMYMEKDFDINDEAFANMGLSALTPSQMIAVLEWSEKRVQDAKATAPYFACGREGGSLIGHKPEDFDKVRVYVNASGDVSEVISGVRERLRSMNDVEMVYSAEQSDLSIHMVVIESKSKGDGQRLGNAVSVVVTYPCTWKFGEYISHYDDLQNQFIQVGSDYREVIDSIVSVVDTDNIEHARKMNAGYKKLLMEQPSKK